ncbi:zinc finger, C3HC4 type (RING finger) domain containing protein [Hordeum vulgare]|nr:zinc finger, C3HC4 type (RING finger) domain containing protein [Hordeum vulgare]
MIHYHHDRDMLGIDYEDTVFRSIIPVNDIGLHSWFIPLIAVCAPEMHPALVQREGRHRLRNMLAAIQARLHCPTAAVPLWKHTNELRGNWEVARHDFHDSQVITMVPSERDFMDEYDDYFPVRTRSSALCCRTVAIINTLCLDP